MDHQAEALKRIDAIGAAGGAQGAGMAAIAHALLALDRSLTEDDVRRIVHEELDTVARQMWPSEEDA